jgi:hypothetical protein
MPRAASPASVRPERSPARGSVVDAAVAMGGSVTGRTAGEPAHAIAVSAPTASASDATPCLVT